MDEWWKDEDGEKIDMDGEKRGRLRAGKALLDRKTWETRRVTLAHMMNESKDFKSFPEQSHLILEKSQFRKRIK